MEKEDGKCPISLGPMDDPVLTRPTYHIFDRASITEWMSDERNKNADPLSKEEITSLIDLPELKEEIKRVKKENPSFFEG